MSLKEPLILRMFFLEDRIWQTLFFQFSSRPISYISLIFLMTYSFESPSGLSLRMSSTFLSIDTSSSQLYKTVDFLSLIIFCILDEIEEELLPNSSASFCSLRLLKTALELIIFSRIQISSFDQGFLRSFSTFSPCWEDEVLLLEG